MQKPSHKYALDGA